MSNEYEELQKLSLNDLLNKKRDRRIAILREFLDEDTKEFIMQNNTDFINRISIKSLMRSSQFFTSLEGFDYLPIIKWFPIMLDYDRFNILLSYLRSKGLTKEEIVKLLGTSIELDFALADVIYESGFEMNQDKLIKGSADIQAFSNVKMSENETFNKLLNKSIKEYGPLLRKLK